MVPSSPPTPYPSLTQHHHPTHPHPHCCTTYSPTLPPPKQIFKEQFHRNYPSQSWPKPEDSKLGFVFKVACWHYSQRGLLKKVWSNNLVLKKKKKRLFGSIPNDLCTSSSLRLEQNNCSIPDEFIYLPESNFLELLTICYAVWGLVLTQ